MPAAAAHRERADVRDRRAVRTRRDDDPLVPRGRRRIVDAAPQEHRAVRPAARHPSPAPALIAGSVEPRHRGDLPSVVRLSHGSHHARGGWVVERDGRMGAVREEPAAGPALRVPRRRVDRAVAPRADVGQLRARHRSDEGISR